MSQSKVGSCTACGLIFHLVLSSAVLHRHDNLVDMNILDEGMCVSPNSHSGSDMSLDDPHEPFDVPSPPFNNNKRIPRAVRHKASVVFQYCLKDVIQSRSLANWKRLLSFAVAQRQPFKGGRRFNLSRQIFAQLEAFDSGESSNSTPGRPYPHKLKKKVSSLQGCPEQLHQTIA